MASCAGLRRFGGFLAVLSCVSAYLVTAAGPAAATGASAPGSIVYAKSKDIYLTTPNGSAQVRVTTDGSTPTADHAGDTGYSVPSESDNGLIVAVRNQEINAGQADEYTQGYLWEMDRSGRVIRKFKPPQFDYIPNSNCSPPVSQLPLGIINAVVSPDGKYIAYTGQTYVQGVCGDVVQGYSSWVVKSDGTGARMLDDGTSDTASLEIGQWTADSSKLLIDRADFGSVADYYVNVPNFDTHVWTSASDYIDAAYGQPDVRGGILATEGYSENTSRNALRLWTTSGFTSDPSMKCDYSSPVADGGFSDLELISRPAVAPDGSYVAWEDSSSDGTVAKTGQGIYLLPTSSIDNNCSTDSSLFIARGEDPFWTPAGIYGPPVVSFTAQPPAVTNSTTAQVQFSAADPDPAGHIAGYTCSLDGAAPHACTSPQDLSGLADGTHTFTVVASDGAQTGTGQVTWRVDTQAPTVAMTTPTTAATIGASTKVSWSGTDAGAGIAHYALRYRQATYNSGFGAWTQPSAWQNLTTRAVTATGLAPGYDYCYSVSAVDEAGNSSPWSSPRCTAVPLDDRALTASPGWHSITGSAYYNHTARTATTQGSTLSRTSATLDRIALLATTCRGCGTAGIYVGKHLLGRVSLAATATHNRVLKGLPVFGTRTGTVSVKVLTSGKRVTVDGLLISRT